MDLCIVCLILGHLEILILKPSTKSYKRYFHLDIGLLFATNDPWQAASCFQTTTLWSSHCKGIWNSRLLVIRISCHIALSSFPSHNTQLLWNPQNLSTGGVLGCLSTLNPRFCLACDWAAEVTLSYWPNEFGYPESGQDGSRALSTVPQQSPTGRLCNPSVTDPYPIWCI